MKEIYTQGAVSSFQDEEGRISILIADVVAIIGADEAMGLGTALINAAFPYQASARERWGGAPQSKQPQTDVRDFISARAAEVDTVQSTHSIGESGACDCPQCISMATARG